MHLNRLDLDYLCGHIHIFQFSPFVGYERHINKYLKPPPRSTMWIMLSSYINCLFAFMNMEADYQSS